MHRACLGLFAMVLVAVHRNGIAAEVTAEFVPSPGLNSVFNIGAGMAFDPPAVDPFDNRTAQTFIAAVAGQPVEASVVAYRINTTAPLWLDVVKLSGGQVADVIASGSVAADVFSTDALNAPYVFTVASLTPVGALVAGEEYALVLRSATPDANYRIHGTSAQPYVSGQLLRSQNSPQFQPQRLDSDIFFRVAVAPVPEPTSAALLCAFAAFAIACRGGRV